VIARRALLPLPFMASGGHAQTRAVTLLVPFNGGAPPDLVARLLAAPLARRWGRPAVIDNRPGASGTIGAEAASRAAPDGETLLLHTMTLAISASLYRNLRYDPLTAFAPVATLVETGYGLCTHAAIATDFPGLLAAARRGGASYASPGVGTPHHLAMELLRRATGIELLHVPYRGSGGAVTAVIAGEVAAMFMPIGAAVELAKDARVRLVAVAEAERLPAAPDVPTMAELGVAGVTVRDWFGVFAPARTPAETIARLNADLNAALHEPEVAQALAAQSLRAVGGGAEALRERLAADLPRWEALIRAAKITPD